MGALEICLLVIGAIVIAVSFIFSEQLQKDDMQEKFFSDGKFSEVAQEIIKKEVERELSLIVDENMDEAKRELNRISAEKILAMGEYSEDINLRISKNHEEVMFLYNMLNDKETVIKNTMKDIEALKSSVKRLDVDAKLVEESVKVEKQDNVVNQTEAVEAHIQAQNDINGVKTKEISKKSKVADKKGNNNKIILDLYKHGMSSVDIAKQLGLGVGEVDLIIGLYNSKKTD